MSTPAEHYAIAERLLAMVARADRISRDDYARAVLTLARAQVHATLAAVPPETWHAAQRQETHR
jgi:hypothetical protein